MNPLPPSAPAGKAEALLSPTPGVDTWNLPSTQAPAFVMTYHFSGLSAAEQTALQAALAEFEAVMNIDFVQAAAGDPDPDLELFHADLDRNGGEGGYNYSFSTDGSGQVTSKTWDAYAKFDDGHDLSQPEFRNLILHEIGHALGLKHPGPYDVGGNIPPSPYLPAAEDNNLYTVMSYNGAPGTGNFAPHLMLYDVLALQARWGANYDTRAGNTVYFGLGSDPAFALADGGSTMAAVWDGGGIDTFSAANQTGAATIDLHEGAFSTIGSGVGTIAIAYGAVIENATGGLAGDTLIGNDVNNALRGLSGNDNMTGGAGRDVLIGNAGADRMSGEAGIDRLTGGGSSDTFVFAIADGATDRIADFTAIDTLEIAASAFGGGLAAGMDLAAEGRFVAGATPRATDGDGTFLYDTDTGLLRFDANGNAAGGLVNVAILTGAPILTAGDFEIV